MFNDAAYADVALQQGGTSGAAEFEQIEVQPVQVRASFVWWRIFFAILWIFTAVIYFPRCRLHRRKLRILILLNALVIISGALAPSEWIEDASEQMEAIVKRVKPPAVASKSDTVKPKIAEKKPIPETTQIDRFNEVVGGAHRVGHFALFASLCFLVYLSAALEHQHRSYYFKVAFDILLFAAITESLQHLTLDRTAGIYDWLTDVYGMLSALVLFLVVQGLSLKYRRTKKAMQSS
jgi:VanZ family protein